MARRWGWGGGQWLKAEAPEPSGAAMSIGEWKLAGELTTMTPDMWKSEEPDVKSTTCDATVAMRCRPTIQKIMEKAAKENIIPYYAEYLGDRENAAAVFGLRMLLFIKFTTTTRPCLPARAS